MDGNLIATWTCEIGVVPHSMVPDGGDGPLRGAVGDCWEKMFPGVPFNIYSGWGTPTPALPEFHSEPDRPNLGLATTEELFRELIARFTIGYHNDISQTTMVSRAIVLAEILGGLDAPTKEYRTVDS